MLGRILAIFLAFAGVIGVILLATVAFQSSKAPPPSHRDAPKVALTKILVAARDVSGGTLLKPTDIVTKSVAADDVPADTFRDTRADRQNLSGALLRISVSKGGAISPQAVVQPGDHGFLAAILQPGKTAVALHVDAVSGLSGLIWPGDVVNLIVTRDLDIDGQKPLVSETLLSGLRVIAIDNDLEHGRSPGSKARDDHTIMLEVTPEQAEIVTLASQMGHAALALRSIADGTVPLKPHATLARDISPGMAQFHRDLPHSAQPAIHVFNGVTEGQ